MTICRDTINVSTNPLEMQSSFEEKKRKEISTMSIRKRKAKWAIESAKILDNIMKIGLVKAKANAARADVPLHCWKNALAQYRFKKTALHNEKKHDENLKKYGFVIL